jgi:hypothetical protein
LPTRSLQFDGPDLEAVLEEALAEAGPGSRIVAADRVRKGGIAGFFAREHFEVRVEVDDDGGHPAGRRGARGASDAQGAGAPSRGKAPGRSPAPHDGPDGTRASGTSSVTATATAPPRTFAELADGTEDVVELTGDPSPTGGPPPGVATSVESAIAGRRTTSPPSGPATAPARSAGLPGTDPGEPGDAVPSTARSSFASLLAGIARDTAFPAGSNVLTGAERAEAWTGRIVDPVEPHAAHDDAALHDTPGPSAARRRAAGAFASATALVRPDERVGPVGAEPGRDTTTAAGTHPGDAIPASTSSATRPPDGQTALALSAVGLPGPLQPAPDVLGCLDTLAGTEDAAAYLQLAVARSLRGLPAVPAAPTGGGRLLVVAGELDRAWEVARRLAAETGGDATEVHVAAAKRPRRRVERRLLVTGEDDASQLMSERRRSRTVTVVALDAPVSARPDPFCRNLLDALVPTAVWGVASATHKSEDVAAWADELGGLDALAVVDATRSTSPGSLLELGIPVASLDGRTATPALWAAVLVGQLLLTQGVRRVHGATGG